MAATAAMAHKVLTPRLVVLALAVGLVLAAISVPVGAVLAWRQSRVVPPLGTNPPMFTMAEYFRRDGHVVLVTRRDFLTGTIWSSSVAPESSTTVLHEVAGILNARLVERGDVPAPVRAPLDGRDHRRNAISAGFPFEAAYGTWGWSMGGPASVERGIVEGRVLGRWWTVPYLPRWWGLLGNTLVYALVALGIMALLRHRTLSRRRAAGRCVACAYELGEGVAVCPECGLGREA